eukprot:403333790
MQSQTSPRLQQDKHKYPKNQLNPRDFQHAQISDENGDFTITEALISSQSVKKLQQEVQKMKAQLQNMLPFVQKHHATIKSGELVDEIKLQVIMEMFKKEFDNKMTIEMNIFKGRVKEKLKKRCKLEDIESRIVGKVQHKEFMKNTEKIMENYKVLENRITHLVNVQKVDTLKGLDKKADNREVELLKRNKADKEAFQELIVRFNELEEMAKLAMQESSDEEDSEEDEEIGDPMLKIDEIGAYDTSEINRFNSQIQDTKDRQLVDNLAQESLTASHKVGSHMNSSPLNIKQNENLGIYVKETAMKIYDDKSDHTFGGSQVNAIQTNDELKKQVSVNIPQIIPSQSGIIDDIYDQVKFKESQSELSQFINTQQQYHINISKSTMNKMAQNPTNSTVNQLNDTKSQLTPLQQPSQMTNKSKKSAMKSSATGSKNPFKKKTQRKLEKLQQYTTSMFDDLQKRLNEQKVQIISNGSEIVDIMKNQNIMKEQIEVQCIPVIDKHKLQLVKIEKEIERLQRIDVKLNKELVVKPYNYIDRIKESFEKEWAETKKKLTDNNEKYMGKFVSLESNVGKLLTDTHSLVDQYKKKIGQIGADLQAIKTIRDTFENKLNLNRELTDKIDKITSKSMGQMNDQIAEMREKLKNEIGNLKEETHGFMRELQRNQLLTRELQQEFMKILDEKKNLHSDFISNIKQTQQQITKRELGEKKASNLSGFLTTDMRTPNQNDQSLATLLPQLKAHSSTSNQETLSRQIKLNKLFSDKKSVDYGNNSLLNSVKKNILNNLSFIEDSETQRLFTKQTNLKQSTIQNIKSKTPLRQRQNHPSLLSQQLQDHNYSSINNEKTSSRLSNEKQSNKAKVNSLDLGNIKQKILEDYKLNLGSIQADIQNGDYSQSRNQVEGQNMENFKGMGSNDFEKFHSVIGKQI